jgi:uncharacterized protein YbcV (DUF1398 family)
MKQETIAVMQECAALSLAGKISFGEVVGKLTAAGVERYHADYTRQEITYYMPDGESLLVPAAHAEQAIAEPFSAKAVEAAVRQIQRGQIIYAEFVRQTVAAGCVGYFVQITGRRVQYFGRTGDFHLEVFPSAPTK